MKILAPMQDHPKSIAFTILVRFITRSPIDHRLNSLVPIHGLRTQDATDIRIGDNRHNPRPLPIDISHQPTSFPLSD
jgi:hypothetical protein